MEGNLCVETCPGGKFESNNKCLSCNINCKDCFNISTQCSSCSSNKFLDKELPNLTSPNGNSQSAGCCPVAM